MAIDTSHTKVADTVRRIQDLEAKATVGDRIAWDDPEAVAALNLEEVEAAASELKALVDGLANHPALQRAVSLELGGGGEPDPSERGEVRETVRATDQLLTACEVMDAALKRPPDDFDEQMDRCVEEEEGSEDLQHWLDDLLRKRQEEGERRMAAGRLALGDVHRGAAAVRDAIRASRAGRMELRRIGSGHRRAPGAKPVRRRGGRRTTAPRAPGRLTNQIPNLTATT